jgi:hypothetical protein
MINGYPGGYGATTAGWRIKHSLWLLVPILGGGCFSGVGLLIVGLVARKPAWWVAGLLYVPATWAAFLIMGSLPEKSTASDVGVLVFLLIWLACIVHSIAVNPLYLRNRAANVRWFDPAAAYGTRPLSGQQQQHQPIFQPPPFGQQHQQQQPVFQQPPMFYQQPPISAPLPPPVPEVVDVNAASALEFVLALNFDGVRAQALVEARKARGGFADVEDFAVVAELVPYELEALRSRLVCGPAPRA